MNNMNSKEKNSYDEEKTLKLSTIKQRNKQLSNGIIKLNILGNIKKKIRRSRIIICEPNESLNENYKKDVYDPETKYKKSIISAMLFNGNLDLNRKQISQEFLKKKVKSAFEREPIEKSKGFYFNVPFMPSIAMFSSSTMTTTSVQQGTKQIQNINNNPSIYSQKPDLKSSNTTTSQDKSVSVNLNSYKQGNAAFLSNKNLFNVNQINHDTIQNNSVINNEMQNEFSKDIRIELNTTKGEIISKHEINTNNFSGSVNHKFNHPVYQDKNLVASKNILKKPDNYDGFNTNISSQQINGVNKNIINSQNHNDILNENIMTQIKYKNYLELYKSDPEKLKTEIGLHEYSKFQNFILKNYMRYNRQLAVDNSPQSNNPQNNSTIEHNKANLNQINIQLLKSTSNNRNTDSALNKYLSQQAQNDNNIKYFQK